MILLLGLALGAPLSAQPDDDEAAIEARLQAVRQQIAELTAAQRALAEQRELAGRSLREVDEQIGSLTREQGETADRIAEGEARLQQLEADRAEVAAGLETQREALAAQLRAVHALGRHQQLKLLLAQDQVGRVGRVLTYHDYLQRDRIDRIGRLLQDMQELADATAAVDRQRERLTGLFDRQGEQIDAVAEGRAAREALLAELDARHADQAARLATLGRDEAALLDLLQSLQDVFADIPDQLDGQQPLAELRGQLDAPLQGRLLAGFGSELADGRPSRGWLIEAEEGTEVQNLKLSQQRARAVAAYSNIASCVANSQTDEPPGCNDSHLPSFSGVT